MFVITKRPLAKEDLKNIWRYTFNQWGEKQANKYLKELGHGIDRLIEPPKMGIPCPYEAKYRQYFINHHIVFYRITETEIIITRVLHERMEPTRHLTE